jgi:GMP synthase (glutamine-hydrolysing)
VVEREPPGFEVLATTNNGLVAAMASPARAVYGVQFHPEVLHTPKGTLLLENFARGVCGCTGRWTMEDYLLKTQQYIRETIGGNDALVLVSGGVDSTVAAAVVAKTRGIGRVFALHIDTGLMRRDESRQVAEALRGAGVENLAVVDAGEEFLASLKGVTEPEQKRKIIGDLFIRIQSRELAKLGLDPGRTFLVQGTLYTDLVESGRGKGAKTAVIKSHHNVNSPLVEELRRQGRIVEPNRDIFKDEVRKVGELLGLPEELVWRHPFPGPGLAIRILGEVTKERADLLREVDAIFIEEIRRAGLYRKIWQAFAVLLPVKSVGVMGDERTYSHAVALRAVDSSDGMTADWSRIPHEVLESISSRVVNEVKGVNRVLFDVTSKPPATIEFE